MTLNDRFTGLANRVTERLGEWPATATVAGIMLLWLGLGPLMGFSDTWQLAINTPTTIFEAFTGLLALAAANRIEARNHALQEQQQFILEAMLVLLKQVQKNESEVLAEVRGVEEVILANLPQE